MTNELKIEIRKIKKLQNRLFGCYDLIKEINWNKIKEILKQDGINLPLSRGNELDKILSTVEILEQTIKDLEFYNP